MRRRKNVVSVRCRQERLGGSALSSRSHPDELAARLDHLDDDEALSKSLPCPRRFSSCPSKLSKICHQASNTQKTHSCHHDCFSSRSDTLHLAIRPASSIWLHRARYPPGHLRCRVRSSYDKLPCSARRGAAHHHHRSHWDGSHTLDGPFLWHTLAKIPGAA